MVTVADGTRLIAVFMPEPQAGLLSGILFGTRSTLDPGITEALISTGTIHIVALSGTNITLLITILSAAVGWLLPRKAVSVAGAVAVVAFVLWVGPSPSIVRAAIMGCISLFAVVFGRRVWGALSWIVAVVTMLLANGSLITDISFQLSALSSLGLVIIDTRPRREPAPQRCNQTVITIQSTNPVPASPTISDRIRNQTVWLVGSVMAGCRDCLMTTLAAQAFTIPVIFWTFRRISFVSPLTNMLIGWVIPPATACGICLVVLGTVFPWAAAPFGWAASVLLSYLLAVVRLTARLPWTGVGA